MKKTKVKFYKDESGIFAYFPEEMHSGENRVCYSHVGQHSSCHPDYLQECEQVSTEAAKDLIEELESIGYKLEILA